MPAIASILSHEPLARSKVKSAKSTFGASSKGSSSSGFRRIILSLFLLDFGVTLVGFYRPILPIFAADVFNMGASGLGLLYAAPSAGSLLGSMTLLMAGDIRHKA